MIDELRQAGSAKGTRGSAKAAWSAALTWGVEQALALPILTRLYLDTARRPEPLFADRALSVLDVQTDVIGDLDAIPSAGPLIVVANHPTGALDGLVLASLLARRRADVRMLANHLLASIPDLRDDLILVDPFGGRDAIARNRAPLRDAVRWIRDGHCLCLFPAGVVSHLRRAERSRAWAVTDPEWHHSLGRLVQATGASILPCFIDGRNSTLFQVAGLAHARLRTLLLPRELLRQRHTRVVVRVGTTVTASQVLVTREREPERVARRAVDAEREIGGHDTEAGRLTAALRARTDALQRGAGPGASVRVRKGAPQDHTDTRAGDSIVVEGMSSAPSAQGLHLAGVLPDSWSGEAREIAPLLETQRLTRSGSFTVFWASAPQAPRLIDRIGLEREIAFRAVGEGTGRARDLDAFDDRYLHLCAWDHERSALVGAYRVGLLDASASAFDCDRRGDRRAVAPSLDLLYTSTLFHFDRRLSHRLSPAMELGRAFVRAEYQKQHTALMALWTGIGRLVLDRPRTRYLFGAVSIGANYSPAARAMMVAFLRRHGMHRPLAAFAAARTPIPATGLGAHVRGTLALDHQLELSGEAIRAAAMHVPATPDLDALDMQVRAIDREGKGLPVLLRQYLRLGARALAFNIDPAFNQALDVLVVVDLPHAPAALLRRYMGADEARAYRTLHSDAAAMLHTNTPASFDHASAH